MATEYKTLKELEGVSRNLLNGLHVMAYLPYGELAEVRYDFARLLPGMSKSPLNIRDVRKIAPEDRRAFMEQVVGRGLAMEVNGENSGMYSTTPLATKTLFKIDSYSNGCLEGTMAGKRPDSVEERLALDPNLDRIMAGKRPAKQRFEFLFGANLDKVPQKTQRSYQDSCLVLAA